MKVSKKVIGNLEKCYSVAPLTYKGKKHMLVAAEKVNQCRLYDLEGNQEEVIWEGPGGTMSMVQVPGSDGQFLATHKFYSPNDSKEAKLVTVTPADGVWEVKTLAELPFVHRFDILVRNGVKYLIACTLKSGHAYKDDWSCPGKVYCAVLPDDLSTFDEAHPLPLTVLKEGLTKNHGYARTEDGGMDTAVISCENGIFQFLPPEQKNGEWEIRELLDVPASDAVLLDLDGDGVVEIPVQEPFPGYAADASEQVRLTRWLSVSGEQLTEKERGYFSLNDGCVFLLPLSWYDTVTAVNDTLTGDIVFCRYDGEINDHMTELLRYSVAQDTESQEERETEGYRLLHTRGKASYYMKPAETDDSLAQPWQELMVRFSFVQ